VEVRNRITLLIPYYIISRFLTLLNIVDVRLQVAEVFDLTVNFKFINFSFKIFLLFVPEVSTSFTSYIICIIYIALFWILYSLHFRLLPMI